MTDRPLYYRLDKRYEVTPCASQDEWLVMFGDVRRRIVKQQRVIGETRSIWVSTVFLGLDYAFLPEPTDRPVVFETMGFPDDEDGDIFGRTCTYDEALDQHRYAVRKAHAKLRREYKEQWLKTGHGRHG